MYDELSIGPGDPVEAVGTLDMVPHPDGATSSDRGARLMPMLRAESGGEVWVRHYVPAG